MPGEKKNEVRNGVRQETGIGYSGNEVCNNCYS